MYKNFKFTDSILYQWYIQSQNGLTERTSSEVIHHE